MISTYFDLKAAIVNWSHRQDLGSQVEEFIQLGEARIRNDLVLKPIETAVHGTLNGPIIQPPQDVEQLQKLILYFNGTERVVEYSSSKPLEQASAETGVPQFFVQQDQVLMLYPGPNDAYTYSLYYIPKLTPLSVSNPSNWLLAKSPDVYLYASLMHLAMWKKAASEAEGFIGMYEKCLAAARSSAERYRMATASPMRMKILKRRVV